MKKLSLLMVSLMVVISCSRPKEAVTVDLTNYAYEGALTGKPFEFDTVIGVAGHCAFIGDDLFMSLYSKDYTVAMLDKDLKTAGLGFHFGQGPDEVLSSMGSFGRLLPAERIAVYDYNKNEIAVAKGKDFSEGYDKIKLPKVIGKLSPRKILQLNDGRYVMSKSMNYGLATNDGSDSIVDWPLGLSELDAEHPNVDLTMQAPHLLGYARGRGIVGEAYGHIPAVILYNEDGTVNTILKFGEIPNVSALQVFDKKVIRGISLGEKYVYVLLGDREDTEMSLAVVDYNGNGIAKLTIAGATAIAVNEDSKRLVTTHSGNDEMYVYDLSSVPGM